jgi:hypothetical protein
VQNAFESSVTAVAKRLHLNCLLSVGICGIRGFLCLWLIRIRQYARWYGPAKTPAAILTTIQPHDSRILKLYCRCAFDLAE